MSGYFQSPKYFDTNFKNICELIKIFEQQNLLKQKEKINSEFTISMHFRLGDYKNKPECHNILPIQYYINALNYLSNHLLFFQTGYNKSIWNVLYFCEDEDIEQVEFMINNIKNIFPYIIF